MNGGFEAVQGGLPVGWRTFGGTLTQTGSPVWSGQFAAAFFSATDSTKWVYQTVGVSPAAWYDFEAHVYQNDPGVEAAWLRISWYESADGSGSALATVDSTEELAVPEGQYRRLTTGPVQAPPGAHSANARVLLRPRSALSALIYIDEAVLRPVAPPSAAPELAGEEPAEGGEQPAGEAGSPAAEAPTVSGGATSGGRASEVIGGTEPPGAQRGGGAVPLAPQPTPVIRRHSQVAAEERPSPAPEREPPWWPWALAAATAAAVGAVGWSAWWWERGRTG